MSHPILCAHRGLSHACPENTLPAFGAAIALGVEEIEFDLYLSKDGVPVVCHDPKVNRTTNGEGVVTEMPYDAIQKLDAGIRSGELWKGISVPRFEEVLDLAAGRVGLNIHIKNPGPNGELVRLVVETLKQRYLVDRAYIAGDERILSVVQHMDSAIARCCLAAQNSPEQQVDMALKYQCKRLQFRRTVTDEAIQRAKENGLICNLFWSDEPDDAQQFHQRGIDVILTNRANLLLPLLKK